MSFDIRGPSGAVTIVDDYGDVQTIQSDYGDPAAPPVVGGALPTITGGQFAGDTQSYDAGEVTAITATRWYTSPNGIDTWTEVSTSSTWVLPTTTVDLFYKLEVDGTTNAVVDTFTTPIKAVYLPMDSLNAALYTMEQHQHHNALDQAAIDLVKHDEATLIFTGDGSPQDAANWDRKRVPEAGDKLLIPYGKTCVWDYTLSPEFTWIRLDGTLLTDTAANVDMYVETVVVSRTGHRRIGDSMAVPLPRTSSFTLRFSTNDDTMIDVAYDPQLLSRGFLCQGNDEVFGAEILPFAWTAAGVAASNVNNLPVMDDTAITTEGTLTGWLDTDQIAVPGTAYASTDGQMPMRHTEYRDLDSIAGNVLNFTTPLVYRHDEWEWPTTPNDRHTVPLRDKEKNQLPIVNMNRNVIHMTEGGSEASTDWLRGHNMWMHTRMSANIRYMKALNCGRNSKETYAGKIVDGEFLKRESDETSAIQPSYDGTANIIGRYPMHFHMPGFYQGAEDRNNFTGCCVDGAPGLGYVLHDCDADINSCTACRTTGTAMVWEQGREQGWSINNFVFDFRKTRLQEHSLLDKTETNALYAGQKSAIKSMGDAIGDNFAYCAGYGLTGRQILMEDCGASGATYVMSQNNRYQASPGYIQTIYSQVPDAVSTFHHMTSIFESHHYSMFNSHVPFFLNGSFGIGCMQLAKVLKSGGVNNHSFQSIFKDSWTFGTFVGHAFNYLGIYLSLRPRFVGAGFRANHPDNNLPNIANYTSPRRSGIDGDRIERVRAVSPDIQGHDYGIFHEGGDALAPTAMNEHFSKSNPRFIIADTSKLTGNGTPYELRTASSPIPLTDVSVVGAMPAYQEMELLARDMVSPPDFIIGRYGQGNSQFISQNPDDVKYASFKDSFNLMTDDLGGTINPVSLMPFEEDTKIADGQGYQEVFTGKSGYSARDVNEYGKVFGYWDYNDGVDDHKIVVFYHYNSEVLGERFMITARAIKIDDSYTKIVSDNWPINGPITYSGVKPVAADFTINVVRGVEFQFDVLALSGADINPAVTLMDTEYRKAQRCSEEFNGGGLMTLYPFTDVPAKQDMMQVTVTDGELMFRTLMITINIT